MGNATSVAYAEQAEEEPSTLVEEVAESKIDSGDEGADADSGEAPEAEAESEAEAEEETGEEDAKTITAADVKTAPMDFRFPTTNQAKHCFTRYNEFHKCAAEKGEDDEDCKKYAKYYRSICPGDWVDKWNEQREEGTYAGRY